MCNLWSFHKFKCFQGEKLKEQIVKQTLNMVFNIPNTWISEIGSMVWYNSQDLYHLNQKVSKCYKQYSTQRKAQLNYFPVSQLICQTV